MRPVFRTLLRAGAAVLAAVALAASVSACKHTDPASDNSSTATTGGY